MTAPAVSVRRLAELTASQRWWTLATAVLGTVTLCSGIGLVALAAWLISKAALVDSTAALALAITGVRFFAVTRAAFRYLERYVGHLATFRTLTALRAQFFAAVEPLAPARLAQRRTGDLLARIIGDIDSVGDFPLRVAVPMIAAALTSVVAAVVLGSFSWVLGAIVAGYLLLVGLVVPAGARFIGRSASEAVAHVEADMEAEAVESVAAAPELVAFGREDRLTETLGRLHDRRCQLDRRLGHLHGAAGALVAVLVGMSAMTLFAVALPMLDDGRLAGVELAVMPLVALAAFEAVAPLAAAMDSLGRARGSAGRLDDLLRSEPEVDPHAGDAAAPTGPVALAISGLSYSYPGDPGTVIDGLDAVIPAGARAAVVGASGTGKSTLLSLLLRFRDYHCGSITIGGTELADLRADNARKLVATVEQHDHLFDTSVRDNLLLADQDADDDRVRKALGAADALEFVEAMPAGLDERVGEDGSRLSGGERQRLMIARALLAEAPILVLDEATAHLDADTEARVLEGVHRWQGGRTVVLMSHSDRATDGVDVVVRLD